MRLPIYLITSLLLLITLSCSKSDENVDEPEIENPSGENPIESTETENLEALILTDVSYGDDPQQKYDIYLPEGRSSTDTKTILLIHGGGWIEGDKIDMEEFIPMLQETHPNHAIVNMNYVLAVIPSIPAFPNQFEDIQSVIDQLGESQETLNFKAEFGIIGASAGAHLGLVYDYSYDSEDVIKFVADIVGPTDFDDPFYANDPFFGILFAALVDECAYENIPDIVSALSPAQLVGVASSPTLLFYGNQDLIVPLTNGQRLEAALVDNNVSHQFLIYDAGHGDFDEVASIDISNRISNYIDTYLAVED